MRGSACVPAMRVSSSATGAPLELAIGDRIEVPAPGGNWPVIEVHADYGNPKGQVAVNFAALTRRFPEAPRTRLGLRVWPSAIPALVSALQEEFGLDDRSVADQATMKANRRSSTVPSP